MLVVGALALAVLVAGIVRQSSATHSAAADIVRRETYGTQMLHPITGLLSNLVEAQSAAVRGETVDTNAVRTSLAAVALVDQTRGDVLQTHQRLTNLTTQVEAALTAAPSGRTGYAVYSDLVTLTQDLTRQIGDTSHLVHDPELDSYYLMEASIIRLPDAVVLAGRASDLVVLAGGATLQGEDAVRGAVARFGVSAAAEAVNAGLTQSVDTTDRVELGSNIAVRLDAFKAAADAFAPPTMLAELAGTIDSPTLSANARRVYAAATPLAHLLLTELQALLEKRSNDLAGQWRFTAWSAAGIGALGLLVIWLLVVGRQRTVATPASPAGAHARSERLPLSSLTYARQLLEQEELAHTGRAAKLQSWGGGDAR